MNPQQQQMANMATGFGIGFLLLSLLVTLFFVFLFWRIFTRAGMAGALGLIALIPGIGSLICLCILAFGDWRVAPTAPGYIDAAQPYPPADYPRSQL